MSRKVSHALRCLPANDVCSIFGARDSKSAMSEASVESCSFRVRQTGVFRHHAVQLSLCPPIHSASYATCIQPCAELMRQLDVFKPSRDSVASIFSTT